MNDPTRPADCLASSELAALGAGELPDERVDAMIAHVDRCDRCAEVMGHLGRFDSAERGRYQLGRVLGAGAMGIVHEAWDPQLRRRVALKLVRPERADANARERMLREARALAQVNHPNVVGVYDVDDLCVATELVDGETLATWQRDKPIEAVVDAWIQAAHGLAAVHAVGIVHRDVKPANVLVGRDGRVRVGDFGVARGEGEVAPPCSVYGDSRITASGLVAGTPAYMAPEQALGDIDARSDQFALCVALAEAITGERPSGDARHVIPARPALDRALVRGLRDDPARRFPSMTALADALAAAIAPTPPLRWWIVVAAAAAVVLASLAPRTATCDVPAIPSSVWNPARRIALAQRLPPSVVPRLDAWIADWANATPGTCSDRGELRARRARCLGDQRAALAHRLARWEAGRELAPLDAHAAIEDLPRVSRCSHAAQLRIPEPTEQQAIRLVALRVALGLATDEPQLRTAFAAARAIDYAPDVVDAAVALAEHADRDTAAAALREAIAVADRDGAEVPRIVARIELIATLGPARPAEVAELAATARGLLEQLGGDPELAGNLADAFGTSLLDREQIPEASVLFERAREAFRLAYGPDSQHEVNALIQLAGVASSHGANDRNVRALRDAAVAIERRSGVDLPLDVLGTVGADPDRLIHVTEQMLAQARAGSPPAVQIEAEINVATAYFIAEQTEPALVHFKLAIALAESTDLRNDHVATALARTASILIELDRAAEAVPLARRSTTIASAIGDRHALAFARGTLGEALLRTGDARIGRGELAAALAILEQIHAPAETRVRVRFAYARSLWQIDPERALDLAHAARADAQSVIDALAPDDPGRELVTRNQQRHIADIDRWLRGPR